MKNHQKHSKLIKPEGGKFHALEWAITGAPCRIIQDLAARITIHLTSYKIGFIDQEHQASPENKSVFYQDYTDKISHQVYHSNVREAPFNYRPFFRKSHAVFVNGNHFQAKRQIVLINQKKKDSLLRKINRLNDVQMIILDQGESDVYDFIKEQIPNWEELPLFKITEISKIASFIENEVSSAIPALDGLILWGGKSTRMGADKAMISYHGQPQWQYLADLLHEGCNRVFISGNQHSEYPSELPLVRDSFTDLGPYGGLLSKFRMNPNHAIFSLPCDVPFIDKSMIEQLVKARNPRAVATCYHNPETNFPEPLITIWEPKAYPILLEFLSLGFSCPRKVLINSNVEIIESHNPEKLFNANNLKEMKYALQRLEKNSTL